MTNDLDFSFGIITVGKEDQRINEIIDSIENELIPNYEVVIVGNSNIKRNKTTVIPFEDKTELPWITKKKNIITENSQYENIVYLHDYIKLCSGWYLGYLNFGNDFAVCMNKIENLDGTRFRDWCIIGAVIPYEIAEARIHNIIYYSGSYWVAKKKVMIEIPQNESLFYGQAEDYDWSDRIRKKYKFSLNLNSTVQLMKQKSAILPFWNIR